MDEGDWPVSAFAQDPNDSTTLPKRAPSHQKVPPKTRRSTHRSPSRPAGRDEAWSDPFRALGPRTLQCPSLPLDNQRLPTGDDEWLPRNVALPDVTGKFPFAPYDKECLIGCPSIPDK